MIDQIASPPPGAPTSALEPIDWFALAVFALTGVCTLTIDIAASIERSGAELAPALNAASLMFFVGEVLLPIGALVGLIAGIAILRRKSQRKWPGVLALLSPVVAVIGAIAAVATVLSGAAF